MKIIIIESSLAVGWYALAEVVEPPLGIRDRVLYSIVIAMIGGVLAASRTSRRPAVWMRTGMETGILGACLALVLDHWVAESSSWSYAVIAASGLLGLGGRSSVSFLLDIGRQIFVSLAAKLSGFKVEVRNDNDQN